VCFFSRRIYDKRVVLKALGVNGINLNSEDLDGIGLEILRKKFKFKLREGFDPKNLRVPHRIFETETPLGLIDEAYLQKSVQRFFTLLHGDKDIHN